MVDIHGSVEARVGDLWIDVVNVGSLLLKHSDLFGCLFGVLNYAGFSPLFAGRGLPPDCSENIKAAVERYRDEVAECSWVLWSELDKVDWNEPAIRRDERISEMADAPDASQTVVTKWLNHPQLQHVRDALDRDPDAVVRVGTRTFRRRIMTRREALEDTEFPLLMKLMSCLAGRVGDDAVRMTVWFG